MIIFLWLNVISRWYRRQLCKFQMNRYKFLPKKSKSSREIKTLKKKRPHYSINKKIILQFRITRSNLWGVKKNNRVALRYRARVTPKSISMITTGRMVMRNSMKMLINQNCPKNLPMLQWDRRQTGIVSIAKKEVANRGWLLILKWRRSILNLPKTLRSLKLLS
jgi:hypothetical protein